MDGLLFVGDLRAAGISVSNGSFSEEMALDLAAAQAGAGSGNSGSSASAVGGAAGVSGARLSLSATASAGFDSNPFLGALDDSAAASLRLQLVPSLFRSDERNTLRLSGRIEHIEYLGQYESLQNFGADLAVSRRANERFEIDGALSFRSDIQATNLADPFVNDDLGPDGPRPPTGNDITVLGQGERQTQFGADTAFVYALSERDRLRWSLSARADRFESDGLVDSNFFEQQLEYSRSVDGGVTIGASIGASLIDFTGSGLEFTGSDLEAAQTLSPQLQVTAEITPRIEASVSIGVAVTRLDFADLEDTTTALAGNFSLCNRGELSSICINGSRQVLPAAIGGALMQTTGGVTYSLRLSERDSLQLRADYGTASQPLEAQGGNFETINAFARYERQLDERLRLFVSGGVLNTSGNLPTVATNFQALVGVTSSLGNSR
jgi:hypothetical protein